MAARLWIVTVFLWLVIAPGSALADKRVALLVGNSGYAAVGRLANPTNDVAMMKAAFESAGFDEVETALDLTREGMVRKLRSFEDQAADADIAVIYYSGHGMEMGGENYLVPVDASLRSDRDVADEAVPLDRVLRAVDGAKRLKLVILDACRDNPFLARMANSSGRTRSVTRGLARVEPSSSNTLVAFAAKGGTVALDGDGANSPFATALARRLVEPGAEIEFVLRQVRDDVLKATANRQEPFKYGSLGGEPIMLSKLPVEAPAPAPAGPPVQQPASATSSCNDAGAHWAQAEKFDRIEFYQAHLKFFGGCAYAGFAEARIEILQQQAAAKADPARVQPAQPQPAAPADGGQQQAMIQPAPLPTASAPGFDPTPLLPVSLTDADRTRFVEFDATRSRSVAAALSTGSADAATLQQMLAGDPQPIRDADLLGKWRCRSAQIDDGARADTSPGVFAYSFFRCAITRQGKALFLAKISGSQRVSGMLHRVADDRFVFLGGSTVNDDPQVAYGVSPDSNVVAYLVKAGANRLRLEMPQTCCSTLEILEFVK